MESILSVVYILDCRNTPFVEMHHGAKKMIKNGIYWILNWIARIQKKFDSTLVITKLFNTWLERLFIAYAYNKVS